MANKILIIEDDPNILRALQILLEEEGYRVVAASNLADGRKRTEAETPDLVLLDLMLPDGDGLDYCREYRQRSSMPIIIVSAKGEEVDKVVGLEIGADDYLTKPFSKRELLARVKSVLRRAAQAAKDQPSLDREKVITIRGMRLNPKKYEVTFRGEILRLQPKEFDLLYILASNPNKVMNRKVLLKTIWGYGPDVETRTIDVHIKNLRVKLRPFFPDDDLIITVPTEGYKLIK
ncbi:MAG: response regulator transcription factor [Bdellovibrionota bacterium]